MNIAIDSRILSATFRGGILVYTERLIEELARLDGQNCYQLLFSGLRLDAGQIPLQIGPNFKRDVLPLPDRDFWGKERLWTELALPAYFSARRTRIFHAPASHHLPRWPLVRKIITIHDLRSVHIADISPQDLAGLRQAARRADLVISVSDFTRQDIVEHLGVPESKVKTIYLGYDEIFHRVEDRSRLADLRARKGLEEPFFLALGLVPRKNIDRLLTAYAAFSRRHEIQLVLAGHLSGPWCDRYRATIAEQGLQDRVKLLGSVSPEDLVLLFSSAYAFVFPSLWEGFGIPVLEAMACGAPVIASDISALPEISGGAALLVDPYDSESLTEAMETLAADEARRQVLIDQGFKNVTRFSWTKMAREILTEYQALA